MGGSAGKPGELDRSPQGRLGAGHWSGVNTPKT